MSRWRASALAFAALVACPAIGLAQPPAPPRSDAFTEALHVSRGNRFDRTVAALPNVPNVTVFYNPESPSDRAIVADFVARRRNSDQVGLHLVAVDSIGAPVCAQFEIKELPTVLVHDRFGHELARSADPGVVFPAILKALSTARLAWIDEGSPQAAETYRNLGGGKFPVPSILKTMSLRPEWMETFDRLSRTSIFADNTALPRRLKEMIATYVSGINRCKY
ncbi:MAG: hypothetical protein ACKO5K_02225 [Armatimonadota bacterium]